MKSARIGKKSIYGFFWTLQLLEHKFYSTFTWSEKKET